MRTSVVNYIQRDNIQIVKFDDVANFTFTVGGAGGTGWIAQNDTAHVKTGTQSIEMQTPSTGTDNLILDKKNLPTTPIDADTYIGILFYISQEYSQMGAGSSPGINLYLSDAPTAMANYWRMNRATFDGRIEPGWNLLTGKLGNLAHFATDGTSPNYANGIQSIRVTVDHGAPLNTVPFNVVLDSLFVFGRERPKLIFSFDDGDIEQATIAEPILSAAGFKAVMFTNGDAINTGNPNLVSLGQLKNMHDNLGWDIANHLFIHSYWVDIGVDAGKTLYDQNRHWLLDNGLSGAENIFAYPYGQRDLNTDAALQGLGCKAYRTTKNDTNHHIPNEATLRLNTMGLGNSETLSVVKTYVDELIDSGCTGIITGHTFAPTAIDNRTWVTSDFQALVDYVKQKQDAGLIDVVTFSNYLDNMTHQRRTTL